MKKIGSILILAVIMVGIFSLNIKQGEGIQMKQEVYAEEGYTEADFDRMRNVWKQMMVGEGYDAEDANVVRNVAALSASAQALWSSMVKDEGRKRLWSNLAFDTPARIHTNYKNIQTMAEAYATEGSALYQNDELAADIADAIEWLDVTGKYSATTSQFQNWWQWEIGIPQASIRINILLYDKISEEKRMRYMEAIRHFQNDITMSGANRMWECEVFIGRGILEKNPQDLIAARDGMSQIFSMVKNGDGFYTDGSFLQHNFYPYNGGYGASLIDVMADMLYILNDSPWEVTEAGVANLYTWVIDAYAPFLYKGAFMDMVRGREIARYYSGTYYTGHKIMSSILRIAQFAPEKYAKQFKSMLKYWLTVDAPVSYYDDATNEEIMLAKEIVNDPNVMPMEEAEMYRQFHHMDRAVQLRKGYGVGLSMYSQRIGAFESINSENQKSWHTADGMLYLYNNDLAQFHESFWPTVNLCRLPGTTVEKDTQIPANARNKKSWVGGVELLGTYGVSGMELNAIGQTLEAKKSYFMFDDEIVALGAGIQSSDAPAVETIVENRKLQSAEDRLIINGAEKPTENGWSEEIEDIRWASLEGEKADIGYYFPVGGTLSALREERSGTWKQMATGGTDMVYTENYVTMWFDHGVQPDDGEYAYVLLPDKDAAATRKYAENPSVEILSNTADVQAVKEKRENLLGVNFWNDKVQTVDILTCNKKAAVLLKNDGNCLDIAVSDPTQNNTDWIDIELDVPASGILSSDENIVVKQLEPTIRFSVSVNDAKGKSFGISFALREGVQKEPDNDVYVIDNADAGFSTDGIKWETSYATQGYYGVNYVTDGTKTADADRFAMWTPDFKEADVYDVYIRWIASSDAPAKVPLEIVYDGGIDTSKTINQRYNNGTWLYLGAYPFQQGTNGYVKILGSGDGKTTADAVKFVAHNAKGNSREDHTFMQAKLPVMTREIENETFDEGTFAVEDVYNGENIYQKILKKNNQVYMTAELNRKDLSFTSANPPYNETLLERDDGEGSKKINPTNYFSTGAGKLTRASGGEDIRIYHNFPEKLTAGKQGELLYVDTRLKKSLTESFYMQFCRDEMTSYQQAGGSSAFSYQVSKYTPSLIMHSRDKKKTNATKNFDFAEWIYVRAVIDIANHKVTMYCGETLDNLQPWEGLGTESTYEFASEVDGISSIYFRGKGTLAIDDFHVYYAKTEEKPAFTEFIEDDGKILGVRIKNAMYFQEPVNIIFAVYAADTLKEIKTVLLKAAETEILLPEGIVLEEGEKLKVFGFAAGEFEGKPVLPCLAYKGI